MSVIERMLFKAFFVLSHVLARGRVTYLLLGVLNRFQKNFVSVFYTYAGSEAYIRRYVLSGLVNATRWYPTPIGIMKQGDGWGLVLASPLLEKEFLNKDNQDELRGLVDRVHQVARWIGAERVSMAGILPSHLAKKGLPIDKSDPRPATSQALEEAVNEVCDRMGIALTQPVIVLGAGGFIGSHFVAHMARTGRSVMPVDPAIGITELPMELAGQKCVLLDIARRGTIRKYINQLWPELTLLNETYPVPAPSVVKRIRAKGIAIYHVSGVDGFVFPDLPVGYEKAVPCCAVHEYVQPIGVRLMQVEVP